ncbi:indoleamine 2,3-dioxygenase 2-like [Amphiura filiformis]|uniref:indoleamine 2,3-dioxygenase 2-like n=1 Tax=Amphiura filiformis TaxID=82378 RepID=UPI003B21ABCD
MNGVIPAGLAGSDHIPRLCDYDVSGKYGFMVDDPLTDLPPYFSPWMKIANNLQSLVKNDRLREAVHQMPLLDYTRLEGVKEWRLAHVVLSFISSGYVWVKGEEHIPKVLPRNLAIPYAGISDYLGMTPSFTHSSSVLANWKLIDPSKPAELDNMDTIIKVAGGWDESWFFMVAGAVEIDCAEGLKAILNAQQAVAGCQVERLKKSLREMETSLQKMKRTLARMHERCDPDAFYNGFRPFLAGWDGAAFRNKGYNGLIYEGVNDEPMQYVGGSAAQSTSVPAFDAALSVEHTPEEDKLRAHFREYMPPAHRAFVDAITNGPSIRTFVQNFEDDVLEEAYNQCLDALKQFRTQHIQIVTRYIVIMANRKDSNKKFANQGKAGTGGTGFMKFLKNLRDATTETTLTTPTQTSEDDDKEDD